jgi:hypothetical protein
MAEVSSMRESKIWAVIEEQAHTKKEAIVNSWISAAVLKVRWHAYSVADAI